MIKVFIRSSLFRYQNLTTLGNIQSRIQKGRPNNIKTPTQLNENENEDGLMIRRIKGVMEASNQFSKESNLKCI